MPARSIQEIGQDLSRLSRELEDAARIQPTGKLSGRDLSVAQNAIERLVLEMRILNLRYWFRFSADLAIQVARRGLG